MMLSTDGKTPRYVGMVLVLAGVALVLFWWIWHPRSGDVLTKSLVAPQILALVGTVLYCVVWFGKESRFRRLLLGAPLFAGLLAALSTVVLCLEVAEGFHQIRYFYWSEDWSYFVIYPAISALIAGVVGLLVACASRLIELASGRIPSRICNHQETKDIQATMPNLAIPGDHDPRERGSRPLNSNR